MPDAARVAKVSDSTAGRQNLVVPKELCLCSPLALLLNLLLCAVLALAITLGARHEPSSFLQAYGLVLLFVVWVSFITLGSLCQLQRYGCLKFPGSLEILIVLIAALVACGTSLFVVGYAPLIPDLRSTWFVLGNTVLAALLGLVVARFLAIQSAWRRQLSAESGAKLEALQARIHPHFLFNALNTVTELVHDRPKQAEEALLDLSDLLRSGLRSDSKHSLAEELDLVRCYLRIEALRLRDRLDIDWQIDESIDQGIAMPALMIQPLVENAVLHGIALCPDGGRLRIELRPVRFGRLRIVVENPLPSPDQPRRQGNRTALDNICQRLALAYEEGASLKTEQVDSTFRAVLTIPQKSESTEQGASRGR